MPALSYRGKSGRQAEMRSSSAAPILPAVRSSAGGAGSGHETAGLSRGGGFIIQLNYPAKAQEPIMPALSCRGKSGRQAEMRSNSAPLRPIRL